MNTLEMIAWVASPVGAAAVGAFARDLVRTYRERRRAQSFEAVAESKERTTASETTAKIKLAEIAAKASASQLLQDLVKAYGERVEVLMVRIDALNGRIDALQDEVSECERGRERDRSTIERLESEVIRLRSDMRSA